MKYSTYFSTCAHVGHSEVDSLLPDRGDGEIDYAQVSFLKYVTWAFEFDYKSPTLSNLFLQLPDNPVPRARVFVVAPVLAIPDDVKFVLELELFGHLSDEVDYIPLVTLLERHSVVLLGSLNLSQQRLLPKHHEWLVLREIKG